MKKNLKEVTIIVILILAVSGAILFVAKEIALPERPIREFLPSPLNMIPRPNFSAPSKLTAENVSSVKSWATFDYLNYVFELPPEYLKEELKITDKRYPNLSIIQYAKENSIKQETMIGEIKTAIEKYFKNKLKPSTEIEFTTMATTTTATSSMATTTTP